YVEIPASGEFDISSSWTVELWAKISGGNGQMISPITRDGDDCGETAAWMLDVAHGDVIFEAYDANGHGQAAETPMKLTDGQWHHWAAVVSDRQMRLYIDGRRVARLPYVAGATGSECPVGIGYRATHGLCYMDGAIDEVRISRIARYTTNFEPA